MNDSPNSLLLKWELPGANRLLRPGHFSIVRGSISRPGGSLFQTDSALSCYLSPIFCLFVFLS